MIRSLARRWASAVVRRDEALAIPLTRGKAALIDAADADLVLRHKWYAGRSGWTWYARRSIAEANGHRSAQLMHTLLTGWPFVDHVNGNGLDNRRENLRLATHAENMQNRRKTAGSSRFKGVAWESRRACWVAKIGWCDQESRRRVQRHLGYFSDEVAAAIAYDQAARSTFGGFAALNFPKPGERSALLGCESS